ncbi:hypothetical protein GGX14DRAFT_698366 [Mycena pura]|uniref:Isopenicillin N synthase-like Fe(2+) 2OG dioxygenase domain-containing protein n=1 Tax=Mycena pura TaxID=153505 RepID=A0AAD6VDE4_9AGAR|nr:hypothetical protein GGX14DRAFT_698366 [Mycena pura]
MDVDNAEAGLDDFEAPDFSGAEPAEPEAVTNQRWNPDTFVTPYKRDESDAGSEDGSGEGDEIRGVDSDGEDSDAFSYKLQTNTTDSAFKKIPLAFPQNPPLPKFDALRARVNFLAGFKPQIYDCCPNSCLCYVGPHKDLDACSYCKELRWRANGKPRKKFTYIPIIPRLVADDEPATYILAAIRNCVLKADDPELADLDVHFIARTGTLDLIDITSVQSLVGRVQDISSDWAIIDRNFGTITVLYSQPVAALRILGRDGKWLWVKHIENALVINTGDAMELLSGGYYKGTIHRVVQPPVDLPLDQQHLTRLGLFYFAMTDDAVKLAPLVHSPVLQRVEIERRCADEDAPTMEVWRRTRTSAYGQSELKAKEGGAVEEEVISGVLVKHYNYN